MRDPYAELTEDDLAELEAWLDEIDEMKRMIHVDMDQDIEESHDERRI